MNRRSAGEIGVDSWPAFDAAALSKRQQNAFAARRRAIELYVANTSLSDIEASTGVVRCQLYRCLNKCLAPHEDGRVQGWRALVPYARVTDYQRLASVRLARDGSGGAGAFKVLLQRHPTLAGWIAAQVRAKRVSVEQLGTDDGLRLRLRGLKHLHVEFLRRCRELGLTAVDYPFNTERLGIRALAAALRNECLRSFSRGARLAGATHVKGLPGENTAPPALQALDVVEFDGHRLDVRLKIVVRDPLGIEQQFEIERVWLLVLIDVFSRAVLGYTSNASTKFVQRKPMSARDRRAVTRALLS